MIQVEMELQDAVNAFGAMQSYSNSARFSWDLSWKMDDLVEALEKHQKRYEKEANDILKAFGEPLPDNPSRYRLIPENAGKYEESMKVLAESKVNVEFTPLNYDDLAKSGNNPQGRELHALRKYFITRNEAKEDKKGDKKKQEAVQEKVDQAKASKED